MKCEVIVSQVLERTCKNPVQKIKFVTVHMYGNLYIVFTCISINPYYYAFVISWDFIKLALLKEFNPLVESTPLKALGGPQLKCVHYDKTCTSWPVGIPQRVQQNVVLIHRWSLYTGSITCTIKIYPWGICGVCSLYLSVVFRTGLTVFVSANMLTTYLSLYTILFNLQEYFVTYTVTTRICCVHWSCLLYDHTNLIAFPKKRKCAEF